MQPLYLIECNYGRLGKAFREADRDSNSRDAVVELVRSGECDPVKILEVDEDAGTVRDVTDEICGEANFARAMAAIADALDTQAARFDHARKLRVEA
jgi:hypothetical protein